MKKFFLFSFLLTFVLFSSCTVGNSDTDELSASLAEFTHAEYTSEITVNFPDREASFIINHSHSPDGGRASVLSPGEVAGISYSVTDSGANIEFDGAILEIGKLPESGLSPFSCTEALITEWKRGEFDEISPSPILGKAAYLVISRKKENETEIEYRTWFSKEDFLPLYAEIFSDGNRFIQCRFERSIHERK